MDKHTIPQIEVTGRELTLIWFALYQRADELDKYTDTESRQLATANRRLAKRLQRAQFGDDALIRVTVM